MSRCTLAITINDAPPGGDVPVFHAGQVMQGVVHVHVRKRVNHDRLIVQLGRDTLAKVRVATVVLYEGSWLPGDYSYPFWFVCPDGPLSHREGIGSLDWQFVARLHNSPLSYMAMRPWAAAGFRLVAAPGTRVEVRGGELRSSLRADWRPLVWMLLQLCVGALLPAILLVLFHIRDGRQDWSIFAFVGLVLWTLYILSRHSQTARRALLFRSIHVKAARASHDAIAVDFEIGARRKIESLVIQLRISEQSQHSRSDRRDVIWSNIDLACLTQTPALTGGKHESGRATFGLPDPAVHGWSVDTPTLKVAWMIAISIRVRAAERYHLHIPMYVTPIPPHGLHRRPRSLRTLIEDRLAATLLPAVALVLAAASTPLVHAQEPVARADSSAVEARYDEPVSVRVELVADSLTAAAQAEVRAEVERQVAEFAREHPLREVEDHDAELVMRLQINQTDSQAQIHVIHSATLYQGEVLRSDDARTCVRCSAGELVADGLKLLPIGLEEVANRKAKAKADAAERDQTELAAAEPLAPERPARKRGIFGPVAYMGFGSALFGIGTAVAGVVYLDRGRVVEVNPGSLHSLVTDYRPAGKAWVGVGVGALVLATALVTIDLTVMAPRRRSGVLAKIDSVGFTGLSQPGVMIGGRF